MQRPKDEWGHSYEPNYQPERHDTARVEQGRVTDTRGHSFLTKLVHPVDRAMVTREVPEDIYRGQRQRDEKRAKMQGYVARIRKQVGAGKELWSLAEQIKKIPGYAADKGSMSHVDVLRLFPRAFKLEKREGGQVR